MTIKTIFPGIIAFIQDIPVDICVTVGTAVAADGKIPFARYLVAGDTGCSQVSPVKYESRCIVSVDIIRRRREPLHLMAIAAIGRLARLYKLVFMKI
jgi:hypothetical protein